MIKPLSVGTKAGPGRKDATRVHPDTKGEDLRNRIDAVARGRGGGIQLGEERDNRGEERRVESEESLRVYWIGRCRRGVKKVGLTV